MSKGNMLLGYAHGKVGDVVMARARGAQRTSAHNAKIKDVKTEKQILHRAKFANLSMIYSQLGLPSFFMKGLTSKTKAKQIFTKLNLTENAVPNTRERILNNTPAPFTCVIADGHINNNNKWGINVTKKRVQLQPWARQNFEIQRIMPCTIKQLLNHIAKKSPQNNLQNCYIITNIYDYNTLDLVFSKNVQIVIPDVILNTVVNFEELHLQFWLTPTQRMHLYIHPSDESVIVYIQDYFSIDQQDYPLFPESWTLSGCYVPFYKNGKKYEPLRTTLTFSRLNEELFNKFKSKEWEQECINSFKASEDIELRSGTQID